MSLNKNIAILSLLFIAVLISYANVFQNEFAWDDEFFIVNNIHIRDLKNIPSFFAEPSPGYLYRPLRTAFYAVHYQFWQLNAFGYHLNSIMLHFLAASLLFFITLKLTDKPLFSFVVSLFFATQPVHTERITNMTAAFDVFGILFLLLSFFFYLQHSHKKEKKYYIFSIITYLLALFSTEEALTLTLILFLYEFSFNYKINFENAKLLLKKHMPYIALTIFYLAVRFSVLRQIGRADVYFGQSFFWTLITTVKIFAEYILIMFFPINLTIERVVRFETTLFSINFLLSVIFLALVFFLFIKSHKNHKNSMIFFSIGWFFITLLPFSNLAPQITIMADRYLYLPSYGFCLFLAFLVFKIKDIKGVGLIAKHAMPIIAILTILITGAYAFLTIQRNAEWRDDYTLLSTTVEKNPFGTRTHHALALYYRDKGDYKTALAYAQKAVELASKNYNAYENLGTIKSYMGAYGEAIPYYSKAIELNPDFYLAYNNLGLVYSYIGDFNSSIYYLEKAININPELSKAHNDLGTVYAKTGNFDDAIGEINNAIKLNPYEADYYFNLAVIYEYLGDNKKSRDLLAKGLEIEPDNEKIKEKLNQLNTQ